MDSWENWEGKREFSRDIGNLDNFLLEFCFDSIYLKFVYKEHKKVLLFL